VTNTLYYGDNLDILRRYAQGERVALYRAVPKSPSAVTADECVRREATARRSDA
jgi:hypothetical protein